MSLFRALVRCPNAPIDDHSCASGEDRPRPDPHAHSKTVGRVLRHVGQDACKCRRSAADESGINGKERIGKVNQRGGCWKHGSDPKSSQGATRAANGNNEDPRKCKHYQPKAQGTTVKRQTGPYDKRTRGKQQGRRPPPVPRLLAASDCGHGPDSCLCLLKMWSPRPAASQSLGLSPAP